MPDRNDHEALAQENLKALQFLMTRVAEFPQWTTTVAFYAAVQIVEAVFAADGLHSDDHRSRNRTLKKTNRYSHIWKHYQPLWNDSLIARYMEDDDCRQHGPLFCQYMSGEDVERTHIEHNLRQIVISARRLLKDESFMEGCDL